MARGQGTAVTKAQRFKLVRELYLKGKTKKQIMGTLAERFGKLGQVTQRTVENDISEVLEEFAEEFRRTFAGGPAHWFLKTALEDRARAIKDGDVRLAYQIAKDLAKMAGVKIEDFVIALRHDDGDAGDGPASFQQMLLRERERKGLPATTDAVDADYTVLDR